MKHTKSLLPITFLILSFSIQSFAQVDTLNLKGKWALQFQITENFTLGSFQGAAFSGKFHFSNSSALRVGVDLTSTSSTWERTFESVQGDTTLFDHSSTNSGRNKVKFNLQYLYYNDLSNSISMFIGAGISHFTSPYTERSIYDDDRLVKQSIRNSGYGLDFIIGVEWFVRSNIGISAEYNSGYTKSKYSFEEKFYDNINDEKDDGEYKDEYRKKVNQTSSSSSFNNHRVKFGVSVYF